MRSLPSRNRTLVKVVKNDAEADVKDFYSCYFLLCPINFFRNCSIQILNGETSAKKMLTKLNLKIKKKKKKSNKNMEYRFFSIIFIVSQTDLGNMSFSDAFEKKKNRLAKTAIRSIFCTSSLVQNTFLLPCNYLIYNVSLTEPAGFKMFRILRDYNFVKKQFCEFLR